MKCSNVFHLCIVIVRARACRIDFNTVYNLIFGYLILGKFSKQRRRRSRIGDRLIKFLFIFILKATFLMKINHTLL